ncbi:hypothetical protein GGR56DRAFT_697109 [Xylariaceae sp. FL0804]|nr:hypothetical protein GGR56DRAFT_697109 [Xylariaceae sp. FL0804]
MTWTETSKGRFQRRMGENEAMMKFLGDRGLPLGREHWSVTTTASFRTEVPVRAGALASELRRAWMALRFEHPSIAAVPDGDELIYVVPSASELAKWCEETFFILDDDPAVTANQVVANIKPSPFVTAYYLPSYSRIILHTSHWRMDGYGALALLDDDPAGLPWGNEVQRLAPSVEEALGQPEDASANIKKASGRFLGTGRLAIDSIGVECDREPGSGPQGTISESLYIPAETSSLVDGACSRLGISQLAAVHASLAAVNRAGAPPEARGRHYTSTMRFTVRPYLPEPYSETSDWASALYTGGYMLADEAAQSWLDSARRYHAHYEQGLNPEFLASRSQYAIDALELFKNLPADGSVRSEIDISSVEDAELLVHPRYHNGGTIVDVLDVSLGVECLSPQLYLFHWMFRGCIGFQLIFNEACHSTDQARGFLGSWRKHFSLSWDLRSHLQNRP